MSSKPETKLCSLGIALGPFSKAGMSPQPSPGQGTAGFLPCLSQGSAHRIFSISCPHGLTLQASASYEAIPEDLKRRCLRVEDLLLPGVHTGHNGVPCTGSGKRKNEGVNELVWKNAMQAALWHSTVGSALWRVGRSHESRVTDQYSFSPLCFLHSFHKHNRAAVGALAH